MPMAVWATGAKTARCLRMEERVAADPLDADAWATLLSEAQQQTPAEYRPLFERCVQSFPSAAVCWHQWLETELRQRDFERVESLFERCLLRCPHIELWKIYLRYLKLEKRCGFKELESGLHMLLDAVGADVGSGPLWVEWVGLLRDAVEPGSLPQSKAVTDARDAFRLALKQPAVGLEALWKEYEAWEGTQSREQAKTMLAEIADDALVARRVAKERKALVDRLSLRRMPRPPRGTPAELGQLRAWRALWEYEASNPQRLDPVQLQTRMQFTFNQALMVCWFTPQVRPPCARARIRPCLSFAAPCCLLLPSPPLPSSLTLLPYPPPLPSSTRPDVNASGVARGGVVDAVQGPRAIGPLLLPTGSRGAPFTRGTHPRVRAPRGGTRASLRRHRIARGTCSDGPLASRIHSSPAVEPKD
jgi:hypothetical protein